jgi:hypothetical protein
VLCRALEGFLANPRLFRLLMTTVSPVAVPLWRRMLPHLLAVLFFLALVFVYFSPLVLDGQTLAQHDIVQFRGGSQEAATYRDATGQEVLLRWALLATTWLFWPLGITPSLSLWRMRHWCWRGCWLRFGAIAGLGRLCLRWALP